MSLFFFRFLFLFVVVVKGFTLTYTSDDKYYGEEKQNKKENNRIYQRKNKTRSHTHPHNAVEHTFFYSFLFAL
jgi:hypothetical protein